MADLKYYDIILKPLVTEKSMMAMEEKKYTFSVHPDATKSQVKEAVEAGADIIMLDNMTPEMMKEAVQLIGGRAKTECSGNVTKENIAKIRDVGVDYVSSGALTHSAPILDISLKNLHPLF